MARKPIQFRIRDEMTGTYMRAVLPNGWPQFGGDRDAALVFDDGMEAFRVMQRFPLTVLADLVNGDDVPCTVTGAALKEDTDA